MFFALSPLSFIFSVSFTLFLVKINPLTLVTIIIVAVNAQTQAHTNSQLPSLEASRNSQPSRLQSHAQCACVRRPQTTIRRCAPSGLRLALAAYGWFRAVEASGGRRR